MRLDTRQVPTTTRGPLTRMRVITADDDGGSVRIAAGTTGTSVVIRIHDDDDAEAAREVFTVTLNAPDREAGYVLGPVLSTVVMIEEGVCDRTPDIRDEVLAAVGLDACSQPDTDDLASIPEAGSVHQETSLDVLRTREFSHHVLAPRRLPGHGGT